jgi:hypothetical protein
LISQKSSWKYLSSINADKSKKGTIENEKKVEKVEFRYSRAMIRFFSTKRMKPYGNCQRNVTITNNR